MVLSPHVSTALRLDPVAEAKVLCSVSTEKYLYPTLQGMQAQTKLSSQLHAMQSMLAALLNISLSIPHFRIIRENHVVRVLIMIIMIMYDGSSVEQI